MEDREEGGSWGLRGPGTEGAVGGRGEGGGAFLERQLEVHKSEGVDCGGAAVYGRGWRGAGGLGTRKEWVNRSRATRGQIKIQRWRQKTKIPKYKSLAIHRPKCNFCVLLSAFLQ